MPEKKVKICLNTMVKNEAHIITRMLESCYKYIDYWVIQDNGSTDNTKEIITNFFAEKGIPGFLYEEPWRYFGYNRDHALQKALQADHGCDWILRNDADEILEVDPEFDWSIFNDTSIQSFQIPAFQGAHHFYRCWMWNAKLPFRFNDDKRHETIRLDLNDVGENFQRVNLPTSFRHVLLGDGNTWFSPTKFFSDALVIEQDLLVKGEMTKNLYHLFYIAKSYRDAVVDPRNEFPFGEEHIHECCRRAIFYLRKLLDLTHNYSQSNGPLYPDEGAYMNMVFMAECYERMGDWDKAIEFYNKAEPFMAARNEHMLRLAFLYQRLGRRKEFLETTTRILKENKPNPFPGLMYFVDQGAYCNSSNLVKELHSQACMLNNILPAE